MTNEWKEFLAYTGQQDYSAAKKSDTHWMSRFTMKMILDMLGYHRVLTIIARGYLFHEPDGSQKAGDPYERIEYARNALCAWCSVPVIEKSEPECWQTCSRSWWMHRGSGGCVVMYRTWYGSWMRTRS